MVRIATKRRLTVGPRKAPRSASRPSVRVRMCVSWRIVLIGVVCFYGLAVVMVILALDKSQDSAENDGVVPTHALAKLVDRVDSQVGRLEHDFLAWTGSESVSSQDQTRIISSPTEIKRFAKAEEALQLAYPDRDPQLCRRLPEGSIEPAESNLPLRHNGMPVYSSDVLASCHVMNSTKEYYFYNPYKRERHICDVIVPARSFRKLTDLPPGLCIHTSSLHNSLPSKSAVGLSTVVLKDNAPKCTGVVFEDCDVPCKKCGSSGLVASRTIEGTPFSFTFSMEGEAYYGSLTVDPNSWTENKYYATTSFKSDIPLPYFSFAEYNIQNGNKPVDFDTGIKAALFLARNCQSKNDREGLVKQLQDLSSIFRIDSVSGCLHNAEPPNGVSRKDKTVLMRQYLFYLALENQDTVDYVTEKMWGALVAGVVPVYKGTPNIKDHLPNNSAIIVNDFPSAKELSVHLKKVASDRQLYESYHAWRYQPLPPHFMHKYNMTKTHNVCRTCRWAYAKQYGMGWSHDRQEIIDLQIPRHTCRDADGLLTWPVRERWFQSSGSDEEKEESVPLLPVSCPPPTGTVSPWTDSSRVAGHWERLLHEHDGVIDLKVTQRRPTAPISSEEFLKHPATLELALPFNINDKSLEFRHVESGHLQWQNKTARVTVLIAPSESTPTRRMNPTTLQIKHPRAVRIMIEDVDRFHVGASKVESYFGKELKEEWENPVEVFTVDTLHKS